MRIAVDVTAARSRGTLVYCTGFLPALLEIAREDEFTVFVSSTLARHLTPPLGATCRVHEVSIADHQALRVLWGQLVLPVLLRRARADVLYGAFGILPLRSSCPSLLSIQDPAPYASSNYDYPWQVKVSNRLRRRLAELSCRKAARVFFPSHTAAALLGHSLGVPEEKRSIVYHGVDRDLWARRVDPIPTLNKYGIGSSPYILFVSQLYRQKHPEVLIRGFAEWVSASGKADCRLVFAGDPPDRAFDREVRSLAARLGVSERTMFLGQVPHADVPSLYQGARCFVLPTSMETFGFPFVEALASGVPVICADIPIAREICGNAALYFPVGDAATLAMRLEEIMNGSKSRRDRMISEGYKQSSQFSWERVAHEIMTLLHEVGNAGGRGHRRLSIT